MTTSGISVGTVNVIVKVTALLSCAVIGLMGKRCLRLIARIHLHLYGSAPVAYSKYLGSIRGLLSLKRSFSFGYLLVLLLFLMTLPAELSSDFGVDESDRCAPRRVETWGLCATPEQPAFTQGTHGAVYYHTQDWNDEHLVGNPIYQGFRRDITGSEFFGPSSARDLTLPAVVEGCSVSNSSLLPPKAVSFIIYNGGHAVASGYPFVLGMSVYNNWTKTKWHPLGYAANQAENPCIAAGYAFESNHTGHSHTMVEYCDGKHLREQLVLLSGKNSLKMVTTISPSVTYNVSCRATGLTQWHFRTSVSVARRIDLEAEQVNTTFRDANISAVGITPMTRTKLVRTVLGLKFAYKASCEGETFEYTSCGCYNFKFAIPLIAIFGTFVLFVIVLEAYSAWHGLTINVPMSAKEWFKFYEANKFQEVAQEEQNDNAGLLNKLMTFKTIGLSSLKKQETTAKYVVNGERGGVSTGLTIIPPSTHVERE